MITSLIGFQFLRSAQLNQCGQTKHIFHLASNKSTIYQQVYLWDFHSGLSWFVLKFGLFQWFDLYNICRCCIFRYLIWTTFYLYLASLVSVASTLCEQSCKALANLSSFSWHAYLAWNGYRPLIGIKTVAYVMATCDTCDRVNNCKIGFRTWVSVLLPLILSDCLVHCSLSTETQNLAKT